VTQQHRGLEVVAKTGVAGVLAIETVEHGPQVIGTAGMAQVEEIGVGDGFGCSGHDGQQNPARTRDARGLTCLPPRRTQAARESSKALSIHVQQG